MREKCKETTRQMATPLHEKTYKKKFNEINLVINWKN